MLVVMSAASMDANLADMKDEVLGFQSAYLLAVQ